MSHSFISGLAWGIVRSFSNRSGDTYQLGHIEDKMFPNVHIFVHQKELIGAKLRRGDIVCYRRWYSFDHRERH